MTTTFTPGPWHDEFGEYSIDHVIKAVDGTWIANAYRDEGNARLIAATPEMYAALREVSVTYGGKDAFARASAIENVRAILARIEGRS